MWGGKIWNGNVEIWAHKINMPVFAFISLLFLLLVILSKVGICGKWTHNTGNDWRKFTTRIENHKYYILYVIFSKKKKGKKKNMKKPNGKRIIIFVLYYNTCRQRLLTVIRIHFATIRAFHFICLNSVSFRPPAPFPPCHCDIFHSMCRIYLKSQQNSAPHIYTKLLLEYRWNEMDNWDVFEW